MVKIYRHRPHSRWLPVWGTVLRIHRGIPKLLGVHFAALVPLCMHAFSLLRHTCQQMRALPFIVTIPSIFPFRKVERRCAIYTYPLDGGRVTEEKRENPRVDMLPSTSASV